MQLAFDQGIHGLCITPWWQAPRHQPGKSQGGVNLGGRQPWALDQPGHQGFGHGLIPHGLAHQLLTGSGRGALEFQVVGKAAAKGRVDLVDAVGDPEGGHGVGFQHLVDPGLATRHVAAHAIVPSTLSQPFGQRGEHVFHLVKQQGGTGGALQKHLGDLQGAVAVSPAQGVAFPVGIFHFEQGQPGLACHHLGQLRLAGTGWAIQQHIDPAFPLLNGFPEQGAQQLRIVLHESEIRP